MYKWVQSGKPSKGSCSGEKQRDLHAGASCKLGGSWKKLSEDIEQNCVN